MEESIKEQVNNLHLDKNIFFCGLTDDVYSVMESSDIFVLKDKVLLMGAKQDVLEWIKGSYCFVLTSDFEGLPNSLIEAMCMGIPCISTDCSPGGARQLLGDDRGLIVPCGDKERLAEAINMYLEQRHIALIIATQCIVNRGKLTFNLNKYKLWSLSFLLISSCSLIYSINRSDSLNLLKMLLILVIVMIYIESELKNLYSIEKMIMLYVIGVGTTLIYVLLTQDLNQFQLAIHGEASTGRWNGNEIGMNAAMALIMILYLFPRSSYI